MGEFLSDFRNMLKIQLSELLGKANRYDHRGPVQPTDTLETFLIWQEMEGRSPRPLWVAGNLLVGNFSLEWAFGDQAVFCLPASHTVIQSFNHSHWVRTYPVFKRLLRK